MSELQRISRNELEHIITEVEDRMEPKAMYGRSMPSQRQRQIYDFIEKFQRDTGCCPSFEQIGDGVGLSSLATVHKHISRMEENGILSRDLYAARSLALNPEYAKGIYIKVTE